MGWFYQFNIRSKLILTVMAVALTSIAVIAYVSYTSGKKALEEEIFDHLTSVRASKSLQIEAYLTRIQNHTISLTEDDMVIDAVKQFSKGFKELDSQDIPKNWDDSIAKYYTEQFMPQLTKNILGDPILKHYLPQSVSGRYLQHQYISANPNPLGEKDHLNREDGDNSYADSHEHFHPILRGLIERFGYYDMFLIDVDGNIVYTVFKETDYATNLKSGPYKHSNLADAWSAVLQNPDRSSFQFADFDQYRPSYAAPAAFIASPVFSDDELIGVLAFQLPVNHINDVMTGKQKWRKSGLGESGETYLVGADLRMRSISRFLIEDPKGFAKTLRESGMSDEEIGRIQRQNTTILHQKVDTEAVRAAKAGKSGTRVILDYRQVPVLSSYAKLETEGKGLHWVILAEMDEAEANAKVRAFGRSVLVLSFSMVLISTVISLLVANNVVHPMRLLRKQAMDVAESQSRLIQYPAQDEFGDVANSLNEMLARLHDRYEKLSESNDSNEELLKQILPQSFVSRFKAGEETVVDCFPNVTVLVAEMQGVAEYGSSLDSPGVVGMLDGLFTRLDDATEMFGVERFKTSGNYYIAVSGVSAPRLDHARCVIDFALEMRNIIKQFETETGSHINLRAGIDSGSVIVGISIHNGFLRDLWGEPVQTAQQLQRGSDRNTIEVSSNVYETLKDAFEFEDRDDARWKLAKVIDRSAANTQSDSELK